MRFIFLFLFSFLFACDTSSVNSAYIDYHKAQQNYISALLDNDKAKQIKYLKEIIKCGEFLDFNVDSYKKSLKIAKANSNSSISITKVEIFSFNPLTIKVGDFKNVKRFSFNSGDVYKNVFDIKNAYILKPIYKKFALFSIRAAQFKRKVVRVVIYTHKRFKPHIKYKNGILVIDNLPKEKLPYILNLNAPKKVTKKHKIIVIDPGHGGKDVGGIGVGGVYEKDAVLAIAKYIKYYLQKDGYKVYMTRSGDYFVKLKQRTHFANEKNADLFISIHCNIAPKHLSYVHGIETYFLSPARSNRAMEVAKIENKEISKLNSLEQRVILSFLNKDRIIASNKFAIDIQKNVLLYLRNKYSHIKDNGVRSAPFWVLVGTQMPSILIETGYLTNKMEARRLFNSHYQKLIAKGIAEGVKEYFKNNP